MECQQKSLQITNEFDRLSMGFIDKSLSICNILAYNKIRRQVDYWQNCSINNGITDQITNEIDNWQVHQHIDKNFVSDNLVRL